MAPQRTRQHGVRDVKDELGHVRCRIPNVDTDREPRPSLIQPSTKSPLDIRNGPGPACFVLHP
jgi:hypothetical protein